MPIYKGSNEVTSGNLRKGSTNIENGYKETNSFYTNTNGITINFVDAISGATMDTTQFSSVGVPGASFSSFSRTITVDSGRIFSTNPTVSESGDSGNNVTTSISSQTSTSAVLNVSGTYPTSGTTVTLTVNGATQVQLPNLNVSVSQAQATFSTSDSAALGTFNYSVSQSASGGGSCSGGTQPTSGTFTSNSSSYNYPGFSIGYPAGGAYGNGCGVTCTSSVSASKSGYNSGSDSFSNTGSYPQSTYTCQVTASGFRTESINQVVTSSSCVDNTPAYYGSSLTPSGACVITDTVSFGQGSSVCVNGFTCSGTVSATCPAGTVPKNGSSTVSGNTCGSRSYTSKNVTGSLSASQGSSGSSYFYINTTGSITITLNNDPNSIVSAYAVTTCSNGRGGSKSDSEYLCGTNGQGSNPLNCADNQNFSSSGWGTTPGLQSGDNISCTTNYEARASNYTTKALGSSSVSFTL
jgi:hypothetical protein